VTLASSGNWSPENGWANYGPIPHWDPEHSGEKTHWSFVSSSSDQGLLYYHFVILHRDTTKLLPVNTYEDTLLNHFAGKHKPWRVMDSSGHRINYDLRITPKRLAAVRMWWSAWKELMADVMDRGMSEKEAKRLLGVFTKRQHKVHKYDPDQDNGERRDSEDPEDAYAHPDCGGNCPTKPYCPAGCPCGSSPSPQNVTAYCAMYSWNQANCQCIVNAESSGNANAMHENMRKNGTYTYDIGLWQINQVNWDACNGSSAPCDPSVNLKCAISVYKHRKNTWAAWSTCTGCNCCDSN